MEEVISGHTAGGIRVRPNSRKTLFPENMSEAQIERAVRQAYRYGSKVGSQGAERVLLEGESGGLVIQMWLNKATRTIETAYPVVR